MAASVKLDVFGKHMLVERSEGVWRTYLLGAVCIPTERDRSFRRMMTAESDDVDR